jgi:hypothetical protein
MIHKCRYCGKEYDTHYQLGGHVVNCILNPKRDERNLKLSKISTKRKIYNLTCKKCNKYYIVEITEKTYLKGDYNKYCSRICANSRKHTKEENEKISKSLKGRIPPNKGKSEKKRLMKEMFENKCKFCNFEATKKGQWTIIHRKDGKKHKSSREWNINDMKKINKDEYIRVCGRCHVGIHWCMKYLGMTWEEIEKRYSPVV